jgi:hypothetical protein
MPSLLPGCEDGRFLGILARGWTNWGLVTGCRVPERQVAGFKFQVTGYRHQVL